MRLTGRRASPYCTLVCGTVLLNLHDPKPSITGPQKGPGDRAQRCMQYANYIPFSIAAQPFPYPEYLNFSVLTEGMWHKACRHTVLQEHGMHRNKCRGKWEWLGCESSPLPICICTSVPLLANLVLHVWGIWISELPEGRRALGPGVASYL